MTRKKIVAGNWKMNLSIAQGFSLASDIASGTVSGTHRQVLIFPPFTHIPKVSEAIQGSNIILGAQNCYYADSGAFTGEVSVPMLSELGVKAILVGHSERRQIFHENNELIRQKVNAVIAHGLMVIFCCGEPLDVREEDNQNYYVEDQLNNSLLHLSDEQMKNQVIIAYEPIWAIGTGVTASAEQAEEMHLHIRTLLQKKYGNLADEIPILYGGSCNADNAKELFSQPDIDGGLIGGASLKADSFLKIVNA